MKRVAQTFASQKVCGLSEEKPRTLPYRFTLYTSPFTL